MERVRRALTRRLSTASEYAPLTGNDEPTALEGSAVLLGQHELPFSWMEYSVFALLGVAMLWAWNMFLAAAPYFASRFVGDDWIHGNFQSAIQAVSTVTNLGAMIILTNIQVTASYPFRINLALVINIVTFGFLTASTVMFLGVSPAVYFTFLLFIVAGTAWAAGLIQNGAFAFAASFGRPEYMQAIMAGQGVAGVLPPIAQVMTVLIFPPVEEKHSDEPQSASDSSSSAFVYFLTAVAISVVALIAFIPLVRRHDHIIENRMVERMAESMQSIEDAERAARKGSSMWHLFLKLHWLAAGVATTFMATMFFPVFTTKIRSVQEDNGLLFHPAAFIPLAFFFWNLGDFCGRMATILPFTLQHRPFALFALAVARFGILPLYLLCNIGGRGAIVSSDFFYLFVVQILFGVTNGWLGSSCMMASGEWVEESEREAAGGFMGLCLVAGLTCGSLLSFTISDI
ncbi:nucleoside transporter-domain-containing protein [Dactylonectria macrodidyma]|uniref:Nucleoside transporter-domain-containing protein n=1 Tax=Dactylonectria macrodidyma TaxID=307937 RepID=A0A9P9FQB9_9HYPO|nr:nucleoside transporter-domain-containing protein [Dactylonectria macrodidyma]